VTTRKLFLQRVGKALNRPEVRPGSGPVRSAPQFPSLGQVLPPGPKEEIIGRFEEELKKVGGVNHHAETSGKLDDVVAEILGPSEVGPVVLSRNPLLKSLRVAERLMSQGQSVVTWPSRSDLRADELRQFREACFGAKAGITGADFALVESGSFVLTSATEGSQLVSVAPPVHIVLYRRAQVFETLEDVLARLISGPNASAKAGRSVVFVTGQSRTADIEQISIRGVHGPLSIHAILVEDSCFAKVP
jgi:L-lactate utilization protein LutC